MVFLRGCIWKRAKGKTKASDYFSILSVFYHLWTLCSVFFSYSFIFFSSFLLPLSFALLWRNKLLNETNCQSLINRSIKKYFSMSLWKSFIAKPLNNITWLRHRIFPFHLYDLINWWSSIMLLHVHWSILIFSTGINWIPNSTLKSCSQIFH